MLVRIRDDKVALIAHDLEIERHDNVFTFHVSSFDDNEEYRDR